MLDRLANLATERSLSGPAGGGSRMSREAHVRFDGSGEGRFLPATLLNLDWTPAVKPGEQAAPAVRPWLVTSRPSRRAPGRRPAPRLPPGESSRRPRRPHHRPRGRHHRHRRRAHPHLVRAGYRPDGRRRHLPALRGGRHDRTPRPRPAPGRPGLAPGTRPTGTAVTWLSISFLAAAASPPTVIFISRVL